MQQGTILQIKPYPNNAKEHPQEQVDAIAKSLQRFGWQQPIKVNAEGYIIVGHGRWLAYSQYKTIYNLEEVWAINEKGETLSGCASKKILTEAEERAYRLADNEINAMSGNNMRLVKTELILIDDYELQMLTGHNLDILIDEDERDDQLPTSAPSQTKVGDIYILGNHRVMCGDSTKDDVKKLTNGIQIDCVATDPPYNVNYSGSGKESSNTILNDNMTDANFQDFLYDTFVQMKSAVKKGAGCYVFHSHKTASQFEKALKDAGFNIDTQLIWNKPSAGMGMNHYRTKHEPFFYCSLDKQKQFYGDRTGTTVWKVPSDLDKMQKWFEKQFNKEEQGETTIFSAKRESTSEYIHPTQKPVELMLKLLHNSTKQEDNVLDLFGGSGTTLIACEKSNRKCYMMEFDPQYVDKIVQRWVNYTASEENPQPKVIKNNEEIIWNPTI
jgi:DNA modification methylase